MQNLDSDLLRTFAAVARAESVTAGAARIGRSQSAISVQIKRLEDILGRRVFERHGRGVQLSETGRALLPVAEDVTARLDATLSALSGPPVVGKIRFGMPDDHGREELARIIAAFARVHPQIELEVTCALSTGFPHALKAGALDLAIYEVENVSVGEELLTEDPTCWAMSGQSDLRDVEVLPVALFDHACWWRDAAIASLEARGAPYKVVYSSQSVSGVLAAVEAGIAIGLLGRSSLHGGLTVIESAFGLGPTPTSKLVLASPQAQPGQPFQAMQQAIRAAFNPGT